MVFVVNAVWFACVVVVVVVVFGVVVVVVVVISLPPCFSVVKFGLRASGSLGGSHSGLEYSN